MVRIGFLISALHGGGAEAVTRRWAEELAVRGHAVHVYTYAPASADYGAPAGVQHSAFPGRSRVTRALGVPRWIRGQSARDELDVIVGIMTYANICVLLGPGFGRRPRAATVISERNVSTIALPLQGPGARAKHLVARVLYRRADACIAISHPVAADMVAALRARPSRTFVVPNPVGKPDGAVHIGREDDGSREVNVIFVGRLVPQKRPWLFIDTLRALSERNVRVSGTVIGDGPLRGELELAAASSGLAISFTGWAEPWWDAAQRADVLLLTSAVEGFANVLVEAAMAGIPAVASSEALGVADALVPGVTGELVSRGTASAFADGVLRAVALKGTLIPVGWLRRFSVESSTETLLNVLTVAVHDHAP